MFATSRIHPVGLHHPLPWAAVCRWGARVGAAVLILAWVAAAVTEAFHPGFNLPVALKLQGVALAVVFAGYAIGWRWELVGGLLAVLGTALFFVINSVIVGNPPALAAAWFAAPGLLYLEAWRRDRRSRASSGTSDVNPR